ncbi:MAG: cyclophilin-like fold protein [Thermofilaceae archaeon]
MYLRILFEEGKGDLVAWIDQEITVLPLESIARKWKHEIFFEVPIEIGKEGVGTIEKGDIAYWPPGKALCLFYGFSQPYSPVIKLGALLGVPDLLATVEDNVKVRVDQYTDYGRHGEIARNLREVGLKAASHTWEGDEYIAVLVEGANSRVGIEVSAEDFGFHAQTQPIAFFDNVPSTVAFVKTVAKDIYPTGVKLDVDEEGYLVLSGFFQSVDELARGLKRMLSTYMYVERSMISFYGVRRPV